MNSLLFLLAFIGIAHGHGGIIPVQRNGGGQQSSYSTSYQTHSQSAPGNQYFYLGPDGSYDFGFNTGTGTYQTEQKHAGGQVVGKYGHQGPDGSYVNVEYQAVQTGESGDGAAPYREGTGTYKAVKYSHTLPVQPGVSSETAQATFDGNTDGSYSLNVQSREHSRTETGTADGQVQGGYSYIGDDGVQRSVSYTAGQQGFQASGDHLPKDSNTPVVHGAVGGTGRSYQTYAASSYDARDRGAGRVPVPVVPTFSTGRRPSVGQTYRTSTRYGTQSGRPIVTANGENGRTLADGKPRDYSVVAGDTVTGLQAPAVPPTYGTYKGGAAYSTYQNQYIDEAPKPFAFSYDAGAHGRKETQDASGVVRGSYVVNTPDGTQKELVYQADDSGFHIVDEKLVVQNTGNGDYTARGPAAGTQVGTSYSASSAVGQRYKPKSIHSGSPAY